MTMVTKKTGRPAGRPKKPKKEASKRGKGRPVKPIAENRDRYLKALVQAFIEHQDRALAEGLVGLHYGYLVDEPDNISAMMQGDSFRVYADPKEGHIKHGGDNNGEKWRDRNIFRPTTDNLLKDLRRTRTAPVDDPCRIWLAAMTKI
jgi:hypothetical protein